VLPRGRKRRLGNKPAIWANASVPICFWAVCLSGSSRCVCVCAADNGRAVLSSQRRGGVARVEHAQTIIVCGVAQLLQQGAGLRVGAAAGVRQSRGAGAKLAARRSISWPSLDLSG
jgi:hypothetical protein